MTKNEFLEGLRKALGNDLDRETVQENVAYYDGYISVQVNLGRTEEEVTADLGDPWVIAQTLLMRRRQSGARAEMLEVLILLLIVDSVIRYMEMAGIIHARIIMIRIRDIRHMCTHLALIPGGKSCC